MDLGPSLATRAGMFCGTPHYLSPEQAQEKPATQRSDLYALGAVFYEMVTGSVPFDGSSLLEILTGHVSGELVAPSQRAPDAGIGPQVDAVVGKCLEKDPARRFAHADELAEALGECVTDRAYLRDAYRLPGIRDSGIDLSEASAEARQRASRPERPAAATDDGFGLVENERADVADGGETLERAPGFPRETMRLRRGKHGHGAWLAGLAVLLAAGAAAGYWYVQRAPQNATGATVASRATATATGSATATPTLAPPAAAPPPVAPAPPAPASPPAAATRPAVTPPAAAPAVPVPNRAAGKPSGGRAPSASGAWKPPVVPSLPVPMPPPAPPPEPVAAAKEPAEAKAPVTAVKEPPSGGTADVDALVREAQQAYMRRYYAVAIDKAREVLKASPGRQTAYQIIAASSCALGEAADAREAASHLDEAKRRMVQGLCARNGVTLE
jgi:serine/threonine-protein kinase